MFPLLFILAFLLGSAFSSPTNSNYTDVTRAKDLLHRANITDPVTYQLVDRLAELAANPNTTSHVQNNTESGVSNLVGCYTDRTLDLLTVIDASLNLSSKCSNRLMEPGDRLYGTDVWGKTRVFACVWDTVDVCDMNGILEAINEIWNTCSAGTTAGWWAPPDKRKEYGLDKIDQLWCL